MTIKLLYPHTLCHKCRGCTSVSTAKGTVFLRCEIRHEKYLSQPLYHCDQFDSWPIFSGLEGAVQIVWYGSSAIELNLTYAGAATFTASLDPTGRKSAVPGPVLAITSRGLEFIQTQQRATIAGVLLRGHLHLNAMKPGETITMACTNISESGGTLEGK